MCTLTFLPGLPGGGYLLATNRDESVERGEALAPSVRTVAGRRVLAPTDRDAGGTWITVDEQGRCLALLNGDMPPGAPPPTHPVSRGALVRELLEDPRPQAVRAALTVRREDARLPFRPFKLIAVTPGPRDVPDPFTAYEAWLLRAEWDGAALTFSELRGDVCLVSSTLQPREAAAARGAAFARLAAELPPRGAPRDAAALAAAQQRFQASHAADAPEGGPLTVCMHRAEARTVSSTQVSVADGAVSMRYQPGWPCKGLAASTITL